MTRNTLNFVIDTAALLLGLISLTTGLMLKFVLPPRSGRQGLSLWSLDRHDWGDIHFYTTAALIALILVHLILHWQWVCTTAARFCLGPGHGSTPPTKRHQIGALAITLTATAITAFLLYARYSVSHP